MWVKKFYNGSFQYFHVEFDIVCYKDDDCDKGEFSGYATSLHYWKTLKSVKSAVEKIIKEQGCFPMSVVDTDRENYIEGYYLVDGKFKLL